MMTAPETKSEKLCLLEQLSRHNEVLRACTSNMDGILRRLRGDVNEESVYPDGPCEVGAASELLRAAACLHTRLGRQIDELDKLV